MDHPNVKQTPVGLEIVYGILKHIPVAIYHIDLKKPRFLMVNEYMCQETGYTEAEFLSLNPLDVLSPQSRVLFAQRLKAMAAGEPVPDEVDLEFVKKNNDLEWGRLHIYHIAESGRVTSAYVMAQIVTEQKRIEEKLANHRQVLERLVHERTSELAAANKKLHREIERHAVATEKIQAYSNRMEEMNTAMRVLLDKRNEDHQRAEELIRMNLKELIDPYLDRLENSDLLKYQRQLVDVIRSNLEEMIGAVMPSISSKFFMFSPNELQVVNLIRMGKTTKEIARLLNLSSRTIEAYRSSIRKKLKLKNKKVNLRTYLSSF